ncbi:MAG TPA: GFA family protein, partial [Rhodanobacteraceae bacterium]|nr:GFA family protein [Rhodanobacteraceae bacterium]
FIAGTPKVFRSSPHIERTFCGDCGTSLAYCSERRPDVVDILTATLDAPEAYPPDREIWLGEKIPWDLVDASLPNYPRSSKG